MAKVLGVKVKFDASASADVVGYKLFVEEAPIPVSYESKSWDLAVDQLEVDLSTLVDFPTTDGVYNLGVAALDDAGNLSSITTVDNVPLDFAAPDAPATITVVRF